MTMRLSIITLALHSLTVVTSSSSSPQHPKHIEEEPFLILDSGARVYKGNGYTPSNNRPLATGGVISVKLPSVGGSNSNDDSMPTVDVDDGSTVLFQPIIGNANSAFIKAGQDVPQDGGSDENGDDDTPQGQDAPVEVDISLLSNHSSRMNSRLIWVRNVLRSSVSSMNACTTAQRTYHMMVHHTKQEKATLVV